MNRKGGIFFSVSNMISKSIELYSYYGVIVSEEFGIFNCKLLTKMVSCKKSAKFSWFKGIVNVILREKHKKRHFDILFLSILVQLEVYRAENI